jgi:YbgA-like uncharacterized protein
LPTNAVGMFSPRRRLARERRTVAAMIALACRRRHGGPDLCPGCRALDAYARERIAHCPYGDEKPTCARCPIHCYGRDKREAIRDVMAFAGPRMLRRHPVLALFHIVDEWRAAPARPRRSASSRHSA